MSDTHFQYAVSDDKTQLTVATHEATRVYTADEVTKLAFFFANLRSQMSPTAPTQSHLDNVPAVECDLYEVYQNREDSTAQVYLRIPGFSWAFIHLSKEQALRMSETLNPPSTAPSNVTFN
jgi:hypothetical protein